MKTHFCAGCCSMTVWYNGIGLAFRSITFRRVKSGSLRLSPTPGARGARPDPLPGMFMRAGVETAIDCGREADRRGEEDAEAVCVKHEEGWRTQPHMSKRTRWGNPHSLGGMNDVTMILTIFFPTEVWVKVYRAQAGAILPLTSPQCSLTAIALGRVMFQPSKYGQNLSNKADRPCQRR